MKKINKAMSLLLKTYIVFIIAIIYTFNYSSAFAKDQLTANVKPVDYTEEYKGSAKPISDFELPLEYFPATSITPPSTTPSATIPAGYMGPKASIETVAPTKDSMPRAATATPYVPQIYPEISRETPITRTGARQDLDPMASPLVTTKASPSWQISASSLVGLWSVLV